MARYVWTCAAAGMALFGTAALVSAQQMPDRDREPSTREKAPEGKAMRGPDTRQQPSIEQPKTLDRRATDRTKGSERPDKDGPRAVDRPDKDRPKGAERPDRDGPRAVDRPDKDRPKATDRPDKDRPKGAKRPNQDEPKGAERPEGTKPRLAQPDAEKGTPGPARLSEQQRSDIRAKLGQKRVEKTRVQVNVNIGSRIPRTVRLHPLPSTIVTLAPAYRGYRYFVAEDDTIIIVDERSYVIVDVIPATTRVAGLSLSPDQMRFIYARVPKDRSVDIRVRLALGAEIPPHVELLDFPPEVLERIPEVRGYRYVVANRDVAIVDPKDNSVALVIDE
jgi:hypothetical protein